MRVRTSLYGRDWQVRGFLGLDAAVTAAENMPVSRRRAAHAAIAEQLDGIDAEHPGQVGRSGGGTTPVPRVVGD